MDYRQYQIGHGFDAYGEPVWVGYQPAEPGGSVPEIVSVKLHRGRDAEGPSAPPEDILQFRNTTSIWIEEGGKRKFGGLKEDPNWFENRCREAGCEWFVPMVKRMAAGEHVTLDEIETAYALHNGKPMPCGEWRSMFQ
jgi:hypothetical protein